MGFLEVWMIASWHLFETLVSMESRGRLSETRDATSIRKKTFYINYL